MLILFRSWPDQANSSIENKPTHLGCRFPFNISTALCKNLYKMTPQFKDMKPWTRKTV